MGLVRLESFLEDHIEGFFNKKFSSDLEPVELIKGLEREMAKYRKKKSVPNVYELTLSNEDYQRLCAQRIYDTLYTAIEKQVILDDKVMDGTLRIHMHQQRRLTRGVFKLESAFHEQDDGEDDVNASHTIMLDRPTAPLLSPGDHMTASLNVIEGPDLDSYLEIGEKRIYLGRRDKNDFILTDSNASRLHAWISYERHRHILHDAQSTNGTFVNDRPVETCCLRDGDRIRIGLNVLIYEVI